MRDTRDVAYMPACGMAWGVESEARVGLVQCVDWRDSAWWYKVVYCDGRALQSLAEFFAVWTKRLY